MATAAKKTANGDELSTAVEAMATSLKNELDKIAKLEIDLKELSKRPPTVEEQIKQDNDFVDSLAAAYDPPPQELISPGITDGRLVDLTQPVGQLLAFTFGAAIKEKRAARIRQNVTGNEMRTTDKEAQSAKLKAEIKSHWQKFESGVTAGERHGLNFPRPANEPVEIFLEVDSDGAVNMEKFLSLERTIHARRGEQDQFHRERDRITREQGRVEQQINEMEYAPRRPPGTTEMIQSQRKILATLETELAELNRRNTEVQRAYDSQAKLLGRVRTFLQKQGIGAKRGVVNLTTG